MNQQDVTAKGWTATESGAVAVFGLLTIVLFGISAHNYLFFHTLIETFAIVVAFTAFGVAWYSRTWIGANFLLMLGIGHLFVGGLDFIHMLTYKGMTVIEGSGPDMAIKYWIGGRFMEAAAFLVAIGRPLARFALVPTVTAFTLGSAAVIGLVAMDWFPVCYVDGVGLTPFKIASEYAVIAVYAAAWLMLRRGAANFDPRVRQLIALSLVVKVVSELAFTLYVDVYGVTNFVGHIFKLLSYFLFMRAIIETGLKRPQAMIFGALEREKRLADQVSNHATTLDAVLDASLDPVLMIDQDGRFRFVSRAAEGFFARGEADLSGRTWREAGLSEELMQPLEALSRRVMTTGTPATEEFTVEGEVGRRCLEAQVSPIRTAAQAQVEAVVAVLRDITTRKSMEEDLTSSLADNHVLMQEVHHRVKNNLQIVSSILQMQGWRVTDSRMRGQFEEACGRILSLAKVHEMLYKEDNVSAVDFVRYCRILCDELLSMYGVREDWVSLRVDPGSLLLPLDKAVPLALIVHELVTNAIKHAFTEHGGELRVGIAAIGADRGRLVVADDGKGVPDPDFNAHTASLGMRMVSVLVKQINGEVTVHRDGGTVVEIQFPLNAPAHGAAAMSALAS